MAIDSDRAEAVSLRNWDQETPVPQLSGQWIIQLAVPSVRRKVLDTALPQLLQQIEGKRHRISLVRSGL